MVEVKDRGSMFILDGVRKDNEQEEFRELIAEIVQSQVYETDIERISRRSPIAQNSEFVAMPPHHDDGYFCAISDGEEQWFVDENRELLNLLHRI